MISLRNLHMFPDILEPKVEDKKKIKLKKNCLNNMVSDSSKNSSNMAS